MKYIVNTSNDHCYSTLEAYAFRELVNEDELFILWINRPAIIVGKHQKYHSKFFFKRIYEMS